VAHVARAKVAKVGLSLAQGRLIGALLEIRIISLNIVVFPRADWADLEGPRRGFR